MKLLGKRLKNLPTTFREKYKDVPWRKIAGMRDILIHEYFGVDLEFLWGFIELDLPSLKRNILDIMDKEGFNKEQ